MASASANGVQRAGVLITNRTTNAIQAIASLMIGAILIVLAVTGDARDKRIALCARRTYADSLVILWCALSASTATYLTITARIHTILTDTSLIVGTVRIYLAFRCNV